MDLYLLSAHGEPHAVSEHLPTYSKCGIKLTGAVAITELQAAVYLDDRRCKTCFPHHMAKAGRHG